MKISLIEKKWEEIGITYWLIYLRQTTANYDKYFQGRHQWMHPVIYRCACSIWWYDTVIVWWGMIYNGIQRNLDSCIVSIYSSILHFILFLIVRYVPYQLSVKFHCEQYQYSSCIPRPCYMDIKICTISTFSKIRCGQFHWSCLPRPWLL